MTAATLPQNLGDGLVLRHATAADADALALFNSRIHSEDGMDKPEERIGIWTHDLLTKPHPTLSPADFTIVEDTATKAIVSSLNLIPQTWTYGGIPFGVGRPELVGTLPDYRRRGLVRAQFNLIHQWCVERELPVQGITGIPFYYRQFGYDMALDLGGWRLAYAPQVPALKEGEAEPVHFRPPSGPDVPFLRELYEAANRRYLVAAQRKDDQWHYDLWGISDNNINRRILHIIENPVGEALGYLSTSATLWNKQIAVFDYELLPGVSWLTATPSVLRFVWQTGQALAQQENVELKSILFNFKPAHPFYPVACERFPGERRPYAWYMRVPDLPGFLRHITPVLEKRLALSVASKHSQVIKLSFYNSGLCLTLKKGRLTVEPWTPTREDGGQLAFPNHTFLQALFGYRSLEELRAAYADCWYEDEDARAIFNILFPKSSSSVWPVA